MRRLVLEIEVDPRHAPAARPDQVGVGRPGEIRLDPAIASLSQSRDFSAMGGIPSSFAGAIQDQSRALDGIPVEPVALGSATPSSS